MPEITIDSPTGPLTITETQGAITRVRWATGRQDDTPLLCEAVAQMTAYFKGERLVFDLPLDVRGSDFQRAVCDAMLAIPPGETCSYGDIARQLGVTPQAVGQACGGNPIPVVIPCHRVLGTGNLGGFSGGAGIETKVWLLRHEGAAGLLI